MREVPVGTEKLEGHDWKRGGGVSSAIATPLDVPSETEAAEL